MFDFVEMFERIEPFLGVMDELCTDLAFLSLCQLGQPVAKSCQDRIRCHLQYREQRRAVREAPSLQTPVKRSNCSPVAMALEIGCGCARGHGLPGSALGRVATDLEQRRRCAAVRFQQLDT